MSWYRNSSFLLLLSLGLGLLSGYLNIPFLNTTAETISLIFVNLLKLISLPLIFLAITSTLTQIESHTELKKLGTRVLKYTIITTVLAATLGLGLFLWIDPVQTGTLAKIAHPASIPQGNYLNYLLAGIPSNLITPFSEGNVIAVLVVALLMSFSIMSLPDAPKRGLGELFQNLFAAMLGIAKIILKFIPLAIWAFSTEFIANFATGEQFSAIALYLACVVSANLIQAFVILPILLKIKGISPITAFQAMWPALNVAFWSKSSAATLPVTLQCAKERLHISDKTAGFSLPLCTTINMNGCAGFIIISVLFVSMSNGIDFSILEMLAWIFIATLTAIGNAGVPMGCYFLSIALLTAMEVPLDLMFLILPFYVFMDMIETAINVWSDACVTAIVDKEVRE